MKSSSQKTLFYIFLLGFIKTYAQKAEPISSVRVKDGANISKSISFEERYSYPQFTKSTIYFKNRSTGSVLMNYNQFFGELEFIGANGDTMLISEPEKISEVRIGEDQYFFLKKEGHVKQILSENNLILVGKEQLTYAGKEKYSAYGQYSSTGAITSYSSYLPGLGTRQPLDNNAQNVMIKKATFFFIDKNQRYYRASVSSLFKIFPKNKREITEYFNSNTINFDNEAQLKDVVAFCSEF